MKKNNKAIISNHRQRHSSSKRFLSLCSVLCIRWNVASTLAFTAFGPSSRGQGVIGNRGKDLNLHTIQPFHTAGKSSSRQLGIRPTQRHIQIEHNYSRTRLDMSLTTADGDSGSGSRRGETNASKAELQKRYEEAMKRRQERRARKESLSDSEREEIIDNYPFEKDEGVLRLEDQLEIEETMKEIQSAGSEYRATKAQRQKKVTMDSGDDYYSEQEGKESSTQSSSSRGGSLRDQRQKRHSYDDSSPTESSQYDLDDNQYYEEEIHSQTSTAARNKPSCQWETYRSTSILFPPPNAANRPNAIIHFVGGTFFGSYPRKFYGRLLEDIALKCDAVVVATPIPLVLPGKQLMNRVGTWLFEDSLTDWDRPGRGNEERSNPLDHLHLAEVVQKEFNYAYRDVVIDEYCGDFPTENEVEDFMQGVPIIGVGHSLGARIQAISCSHPDIYRYLSMGKGRRLIRSGREGMVYLGFANWGASTSIPGIETLERTVRNREKSLRQKERDRRGVGQREDVYGNRRKQGRGEYDEVRRRYNRNYDRYSRYDEDDLDLGDVFSDVISGVTNGAKQIGEALTPNADDLEFKPSPDELWDDLASPRGGYSRSCRNTLIVQFDEDPIDQGSRLARVLLNVSRNETNSSDLVFNESQIDDALHDVKFARLRGGHLTPVSFSDGIGKILPRGAMSMITSSSDFLVQQLGDETRKSSRRQQEELNDVIDTIASYISDAI
ncbi:hypothetical protein HJC23_000688 [Cyclotella cryptica]|uniref:Uncharacterized protein n=1 Tax=Cyclotella cryptica TaxID=29204 RepID=A0ABD3QFM2_9STRA|eukprot:CCRYP_007364-RA/>CCRYP_007364-RA protein AED:0.21 eAED:0.21 QI:0/-1/0/1/-1/1/1/0/721